MPATAPSTDDFAALRTQRVQLARANLAAFCELVGKDEKTGAPIELQPYHVAILDFVQANPLAVVHAHVGSGKTQLLSVLRTLWLLGRDPSLRVIICSSTFEQAARVVREVASYIEHSDELREVFPTLRPGPLWKEGAISVERPSRSKDASVTACGVNGNILGARGDVIVLDDVDDRESTSSEHMRKETIGWVRSTLLSRLEHHGLVTMVATPWHPDDVSGTFITEGWPSIKFGVTDEDGNTRWPARWPASRIEHERATIASTFEASRVLDCEVRDDSSAWFKLDHLQHAIRRGFGRPQLQHLYSQGPAVAVVGVDLAVSKSKRADKSSFAVVLHYDEGTPEGTPPENRANPGDRELVYLRSARLDANEILSEILSLWRWFQPVSIVCESVAAQAYLVQLIRANSAIPIVGFNTGRGKMSLQYQCELLSSELGRGKWIFREGDEVPALAKDLLYYSPRAHTPDRVASLCFARWGCEQRPSYVGTFGLELLRR